MLYAAKETRIANLICVSIESPHGKIELVFEGYLGTDGAQYLDRFVIEFEGNHFVVDEKDDSQFCHGAFKDYVHRICENTWFLGYEWDSMHGELEERAEMFQLFASASAVINNKLFDCN